MSDANYANGTPARPNLVMFITDHQRFDMAPPFSRAVTPNLDRFYRRATAFTSAYCPAPHCCPSRATIFSGLYPTEHGVWNNVNVGNSLSRGPYAGVRLWSQDLADAGYRMGFAGKWHVSDEEGPGDRGFQRVYDPKTNYRRQEPGYHPPTTYEWDVYYKDYDRMLRQVESYINPLGRDPDGRRQPSQILRKGYPNYTFYGKRDNPFGDGNTVDRALEILDGLMDDPEAGTRPFMMYCGTVGPHDPYYAPQEFLDLYRDLDVRLPENFRDSFLDKPNLHRRLKGLYAQMTDGEQLDCLRHYLAFCSYEDHLFGRLLDRLEQAGRMDDTVVMVLSDHGDYAGDHGLWAKGLPCFDGAYHVPLLIGGAGIRRPARAEDAFVSLADIAPTICDLAGIPYDTGRFSGRSLLPFLRGDDDEAARERALRDAVYTQTNGNELYGIQRSVRTREWKFVYNGFDFDELYCLAEDPHEMVNRIDDPSCDGVLRVLSEKLWRFAYEHGDVCINPYVMVSLAKYGPGVAFGWE